MCVALLGASCNGVGSEAPRQFRVSFVDSGHNTDTDWSSQDLPNVYEWDGTSDLHYLQLTASDLISALVTPPAGGTIVFLDAPGQVADLSGVVESTNIFSRRLVPGRYDVFVAPGGLLTGQAGARFINVDLNESTPLWTWTLPDTVPVSGSIESVRGPLTGQLVVPYPDDLDGMPLGTFGRSSEEGPETEEGSFEVLVRPGTYDIVVAPPLRVQPSPDGGAGILQPDPVPPVHLEDRVWPLQPGFEETIEVPILPTITLVGRVVGADATQVARIRIEGRIPPGVIGTVPYDGGRWIAEMRTDGEGLFQVEVPQGEYVVTAIPGYSDRTNDAVVAEFSAQGEGIIELNLSLPLAPVAQVFVVDEDAEPVPGAALYIRNTGPPRYAYGVVTQSDDEGNPGYWFGLLMRGTYEVEVVPPVDPETLQKRWARAHGVLEIGAGGGSVTIQLRRSAIMEGSVFSRDVDRVADVLVILRDPETGLVVDEALTNRSPPEIGFFRAIIPEND
jgi:hypothetical protein